jgi:hypothetical protein
MLLGNKATEATDTRTVIIAAFVSGLIFLFILGFFCITFKGKLERKKEKTRRRQASGGRQQPQPQRHRQPYRSQKPISRAGTGASREIPDNGYVSRTCQQFHGEEIVLAG